jgi:hypothetical protein
MKAPLLVVLDSDSPPRFASYFPKFLALKGQQHVLLSADYAAGGWRGWRMPWGAR